RYAWNAHLPLSILTDFEELAVYNCKNKPSPTDSAATGRDKLLQTLYACLEEEEPAPTDAE
ncbi:MAG TPA: hypothetical protein PLA90_15570, partial [Candidatus Sumerlaeota bacterium]|nr:hypothetical protein [Candidatus Sumerlaeota bacterium]